MRKSIRNLAAVTRVALDLAKNAFQVHAVDAKGEVVVARSVKRQALLKFFERLPRCLVAVEAGSSAHHWARPLMALGFEARLIPPAHVKPYVRRNKNDAADAAAICQAAGRPGQRFAPVRLIDNQAELMGHRTRELLSGPRTAALNALRGHLAEIGVVAAQGAHNAYGLKRLLVDGVNDNGEVGVPDCVCAVLAPLARQIDALDAAIGAIDKELAASVRADETARRLMTIPGVGPVTASAILATVQDPGAFASRREFSTFLGLYAARDVDKASKQPLTARRRPDTTPNCSPSGHPPSFSARPQLGTRRHRNPWRSSAGRQRKWRSTASRRRARSSSPAPLLHLVVANK